MSGKFETMFMRELSVVERQLSRIVYREFAETLIGKFNLGALELCRAAYERAVSLKPEWWAPNASFEMCLQGGAWQIESAKSWIVIGASWAGWPVKTITLAKSEGYERVRFYADFEGGK